MKSAPNMHVYVILAEEHKNNLSIFNHHQLVYGAVVFQIPVLHKHVERWWQLFRDTHYFQNDI
jgi:hypothetical protein